MIGGSNNVIAKLDYSLNDKNAIHGEYVYGDGKPIGQSGTRVQPYWRGPYHIRSQVVRVAWVWTPNSSWVNEARFGYDRLLQNAQPGDCFPQAIWLSGLRQFGFCIRGAPVRARKHHHYRLYGPRFRSRQQFPSPLISKARMPFRALWASMYSSSEQVFVPMNGPAAPSRV